MFILALILDTGLKFCAVPSRLEVKVLDSVIFLPASPTSYTHNLALGLKKFIHVSP